MFGIFHTKKHIATQIGIIVSNFLRTCFAGRTDILDKNGNFHPPYGFWSDHYIIGFTTFLINLLLRYDFNGNSFSTNKKGEIAHLSIMQICKDDWRQVNKIFLDNAGNESDLFKKGADEALVLYAAVSGRLKNDSSNPLVAKAKILAEKRHKHYIENAKILSYATSNNSAIGLAVMELTLMSHVKEKYK